MSLRHALMVVKSGKKEVLNEAEERRFINMQAAEKESVCGT